MLCCRAVSVPILTHPLPPLIDYTQHPRGAYVISTIASDADLQRFYLIEWRVIPNLMMDLVVPVLHRFMNIYAAGQVFTLAAFALILSGTFALHRALFGRWSVVPLAAGHPHLQRGAAGRRDELRLRHRPCALGAGGWIALRDRTWPWRFVVSTLFVIVLFFCHLFAVGLYGLGLLAFEIHRLWAKRREPLAPRLLDFVASGVPFLAAGRVAAREPDLRPCRRGPLGARGASSTGCCSFSRSIYHSDRLRF